MHDTESHFAAELHWSSGLKRAEEVSEYILIIDLRQGEEGGSTRTK